MGIDLQNLSPELKNRITLENLVLGTLLNPTIQRQITKMGEEKSVKAFLTEICFQFDDSPRINPKTGDPRNYYHLLFHPCYSLSLDKWKLFISDLYKIVELAHKNLEIPISRPLNPISREIQEKRSISLISEDLDSYLLFFWIEEGRQISRINFFRKFKFTPRPPLENYIKSKPLPFDAYFQVILLRYNPTDPSTNGNPYDPTEEPYYSDWQKR